MRNGAVQNVFGIRLGLLVGVVGGACYHRWREKARLLFENIEESAEITIRGGSFYIQGSSLTSTGVFRRVDW
jgi:hypothetical protein